MRYTPVSTLLQRYSVITVTRQGAVMLSPQWQPSYHTPTRLLTSVNYSLASHTTNGAWTFSLQQSE